MSSYIFKPVTSSRATLDLQQFCSLCSLGVSFHSVSWMNSWYSFRRNPDELSCFTASLEKLAEKIWLLQVEKVCNLLQLNFQETYYKWQWKISRRYQAVFIRLEIISTKTRTWFLLKDYFLNAYGTSGFTKITSIFQNVIAKGAVHWHRRNEMIRESWLEAQR